MMGGGVGTILLLVVLAVAVWAIIKVFPDWQDRVGLNSGRENKREDTAEETLRQRFARASVIEVEPLYGSRSARSSPRRPTRRSYAVLHQ